ncbi:MAG TPA: hypothetical protein VM487_07885 [Phycisphaerae bacterium]|nr:hypothetical protein [Phycisphaerae bacterium]
MTLTNVNTLAGCFRELSEGEAVPIPEGGETWRDMFDRIDAEKRIAEVDEETYWYFLEVLPPRYMDESFFCFAEGMEPLRLFWQRGCRYYVRRLNWKQTHKLCDLAGIRRDYYFY